MENLSKKFNDFWKLLWTRYLRFNKTEWKLQTSL